MRELNRKQYKSWTSKEEEALAAGVGKHGVRSWRTMHNISKFARYLAQKSTSGLWKKSRTITFRVSNEKLKPLSPKMKKIVAANLELEGINDRQRSCFDDHGQEEKTERIVEMEEDKEESTLPTKVKNHPHLQNSANPEEEEVNEAERVSKMKEFEDIKSRLLLLHEIWGRFSKQDTNRVSAPALPQAVKERMTLEVEEDTDRFSATLPPQAENKETERNLKMEDVEDVKSRLMLLHEIWGRFSGQDTNLISAPAFPQAVNESLKTSEMAEDSDRFSATLPPHEKEAEMSSGMEEDADQKSPSPAPSEVVEETKGISETEEDTKSMLLLLNQIYERFLK